MRDFLSKAFGLNRLSWWVAFIWLSVTVAWPMRVILNRAEITGLPALLIFLGLIVAVVIYDDMQDWDSDVLLEKNFAKKWKGTNPWTGP